MFGRIHRHALWILGEYCIKSRDILAVMKEIRDGLGEVSRKECKKKVLIFSNC